MERRRPQEDCFYLNIGGKTLRKLLNNNRAFTLVELLCYMALFGLVLSVIYSVFYQFSRTLSTADRTMLRERSVFHAVRTMQQDIRRSTKILESFGPLNASDGVLILLLREDREKDAPVIIYRLAESANTLMRYQTRMGALSQGISAIELGHGVEAFNFAVGKDSENLLKVSIKVKKSPLGVFRDRPLIFYTAMRSG